MWQFIIRTGKLLHNWQDVGYAYSGAPQAKNDPARVSERDVGPLPPGLYDIGKPFDDPKHGKFCLRLTPHAENEMYGRAGFLIHGDKIGAPGTASEGCVVTGLVYRQQIAASGDTLLRVIAEEKLDDSGGQQ